MEMRNKTTLLYSSFFLTRYGYFWYIEMLVITSGRAKRQNNEGGFPSNTNCNKQWRTYSAVTRSAETMTNPCMYFVTNKYAN
ncbi:hypothetical protein HanPSC8_Chr02g0046701 [Helianthus annuus]|nr:hypothetical protein HanPSC8_Chr02g0046701 [Helianthus annuus]